MKERVVTDTPVTSKEATTEQPPVATEAQVETTSEVTVTEAVSGLETADTRAPEDNTAVVATEKLATVALAVVEAQVLSDNPEPTKSDASEKECKRLQR